MSFDLYVLMAEKGRALRHTMTVPDKEEAQRLVDHWRTLPFVRLVRLYAGPFVATYHRSCGKPEGSWKREVTTEHYVKEQPWMKVREIETKPPAYWKVLAPTWRK